MREDVRRQEQDATRAVAQFLNAVATIDYNGGDEALDRIRIAETAMDVYLTDSLASCAEDVMIAATKLVHHDELSESRSGEADNADALRRRLGLMSAAHKFHNDFRVSRNLPVRETYI
jgi:hypothetical protein